MKPDTFDVFQVIADPSRREILLMLSKKSMTINSLASNFEMSRPAVSKHIKILGQAGFISIEDIGRERHCILKQNGFKELQEWIDYFDAFWAVKLKKLETLLNNKTNKHESSRNNIGSGNRPAKSKRVLPENGPKTGNRGPHGK